MCDKLLFCNASERVPHCTKKTNLCCLRCNDISFCVAVSIRTRTMKPCHADDYDDDEQCGFLI